MTTLDLNNPEQNTPLPDGFVPAPPAAAPAAAAPAAATPTAPATPAAPAAPAQPAAPAAPATPTPLPPLPEQTGDAALDIALAYLVSKGIKTDDPSVDLARTTGDFTAVQAKLAALGATDAGPYLAAAKAAYARFDAQAKAKTDAVFKDAEAACANVGGWSKVKEWAKATASPEQAEQINAALAAGGVQSKAALQWLVTAYSKANPPTGAPSVKPDATPGSAQQAGLSARAYAKEVEKLYATSKFRDVTNTPEYKALQARRMAGKAAGL